MHFGKLFVYFFKRLPKPAAITITLVFNEVIESLIARICFSERLKKFTAKIVDFNHQYDSFNGYCQS